MHGFVLNVAFESVMHFSVENISIIMNPCACATLTLAKKKGCKWELTLCKAA